MKQLNQVELNQIKRVVEYFKASYPVKLKDNENLEKDINKTIELLKEYNDTSIQDLLELADIYCNVYDQEIKTELFNKFCRCRNTVEGIPEQLLQNVSDELVTWLLEPLVEIDNGTICKLGDKEDLEFHELVLLTQDYPDLLKFYLDYKGPIKLSFDYDQIIKDSDYTMVSSGTIYDYCW